MKGRKTEKRKLMRWCGGTVWINKKKKSFNITRQSPMSFKCSPIQPCLLFKLSSAHHSPSLPTVATMKPVGADCWGGTNSEFLWHSQTNICRAKADGAVVIRCLLAGERKCLRGPSVHDGGESSREGRYHLSATAAAMGTRILPRAVAANSSISVFSRLMTHSIASRPWDTHTEEERYET